jgi:hypothetical protein
MAVLAIVNIPGGTPEQYEGVREAVGWESNPPQGLHFHAAAFGEDGVMRVVDVWETAEDMQNFHKSRLGEQMGKLGMPEPQISIYPAYNVNSFPGLSAQQGA